MQILCNFNEQTALWDGHVKSYDQSDRNIVRIRRIVRDFKENLNRMEEYFFHIQERYNYFATPKILAFLSQKNIKELSESKDLLKRKIKYCSNLYQYIYWILIIKNVWILNKHFWVYFITQK